MKPKKVKDNNKLKNLIKKLKNEQYKNQRLNLFLRLLKFVSFYKL